MAEQVLRDLSASERTVFVYSAKAGQQTAVIAGATGNVGQAAALALARRGFRVVMLGRSKKRLEDHARSIEVKLRETDPSYAGELVPLEVDLTDLESLRDATKSIAERVGAVDVLILSAVTYTQDGPTILPDGNELMFSTNVLGQFRLAMLLRRSVETAQGVIVHVVAPFRREIDWDDLQSKQGHKSMRAYERSKTCHRIMAGEMARRFGEAVTSVAFDPGFVIDLGDPDLKKRWPSGFTGLLWRIYALVAAKSPSVAGEAIAVLVTGPSTHDNMNGAYYRLTKRRDKPEPSMNDRALGANLWAALEALAFPNAGA